MAISTYIKIGLVGPMLSSLYRAVVASSAALDFYGEDADAIPETERKIISKHTMNAIRYFCMLVLMRWWTKDTKAFEATGEVVGGAAGRENEMVSQDSGVLVGGDEDGGEGESTVMVNIHSNVRPKPTASTTDRVFSCSI